MGKTGPLKQVISSMGDTEWRDALQCVGAFTQQSTEALLA